MYSFGRHHIWLYKPEQISYMYLEQATGHNEAGPSWIWKLSNCVWVYIWHSRIGRRRRLTIPVHMLQSKYLVRRIIPANATQLIQSMAITDVVWEDRYLPLFGINTDQKNLSSPLLGWLVWELDASQNLPLSDWLSRSFPHLLWTLLQLIQLRASQ